MSKQPIPTANQAALWKETADSAEDRPTPWPEVDRDQILARYWKLANLTPETTKGNITGQIKALDSLCDELARAPDDKGKNPAKRSHPPEIYRSAWMAQP